ncbi:hypothetical protein D3C85_742640 [compost metagenome]
MKKLLLLVSLFSLQTNFAQNTVPSTGTASLDTNLQIGKQVAVADGEIVRLSLVPYRHTGGPWNFKSRDNGNLAFLDVDYGITGSALTITSDKNIGLGVISPISKLSIAGSLTINGGLTNTMIRPSISSNTLPNGEIRGFSNGSHLADDGFLRISAGGGTNLSTKSFIDLSGYSTVPDMNRNLVFGTFGIERMRIDLYGNIGIGTTVPDAKLAVNGTIHSKEVKVDMSGWPDYVFKKEYNLPTLAEVEKHIKEKGHLENIPSEEEAIKNGINLGEMNAKLLQKIEEMTLYMIDMKKEIERQNEEINILKTKK